MNNSSPLNNERPLVTFALFAYNQEQYIREAIEGAFSQTYEPLEIILSDDKSSDRTFEIMQEMVAAYKGKHKIIVRQSRSNLALIDHVYEVGQICKGEIIVFAAGDDISSPDRVHELMMVWETDSSAAYSGYNLIDASGTILSHDVKPISDIAKRFPWLVGTSDQFVYGASSAYRIDVVKLLKKANKKIFSEDTPLNAIIQLDNRKVSYCSKSLVNYRVHDATLSNSRVLSSNIEDILVAEKKHRISCSRNLDILVYIEHHIIPIFKNSETLVDRNILNKLILELETKIRWDTLGLSKRLYLLFHSDWALKRWVMLRILGDKFYSLIKSIQIKLKFEDDDIKWKK